MVLYYFIHWTDEAVPFSGTHPGEMLRMTVIIRWKNSILFIFLFQNFCAKCIQSWKLAKICLFLTVWPPFGVFSLKDPYFGENVSSKDPYFWVAVRAPLSLSKLSAPISGVRLTNNHYIPNGLVGQSISNYTLKITIFVNKNVAYVKFGAISWKFDI